MEKVSEKTRKRPCAAFASVLRGFCAKAELELAIAICNGIGTEKNEVKAFPMFRRLAHAGSISALSHVGSCFYYGKGVYPNACTAFRIFHRSSFLGCPLALNYVGLCFDCGWGTDVNKLASHYYFRRAEKAGYADALSNLGRSYAVGDGVDEVLQRLCVRSVAAYKRRTCGAIQTWEICTRRASVLTRINQRRDQGTVGLGLR